MRIQADLFMTNSKDRLPLVDWMMYISLGIFLLSSLIVFIFWLVDKPIPAHDIYTRRTIKAGLSFFVHEKWNCGFSTLISRMTFKVMYKWL